MHDSNRKMVEIHTLSWMYCNKNGDARKLSTGQSKNPCISFWCKSIVMTWVSPDVHIIYGEKEEMKTQLTWQALLQHVPHKHTQTLANSFDTMHPRFLILHCFEYGRYGITPTMLRAELVLHAYAMINSSIILLLTSLKVANFQQNKKTKHI